MLGQSACGWLLGFYLASKFCRGKKVKLGDELVWIGWRFCFSSGYIQLTDDKSQKILEALSPFCTIGQKVDRKAVERLIGFLLWYSGGAVHLRPWLQALYHLLYKPRCVFRSVTPHQFEVLRQLLDTKLALTGHMECCDLQQGWVLHAVSTFEARTGRLCFLQLQQCFCSYKFDIHVGMQAFL